jgi:small subunit ribosomal protein S14
MAKTSMINREKKRVKLVTKFALVRKSLKEKINNPTVSYEEKILLSQKLQKLPRDSSSIRVHNRCNLTGRPHGFYRKFGLSRNKLREHAMKGDVPGLRKSSW